MPVSDTVAGVAPLRCQIGQRAVMFRIVAVQCIASAAVAAIAAAIAGSSAAWSALLGGLACALPNGLFALHLATVGHLRRAPAVRSGSALASAGAISILAGELAKLALTAALLALLVWGLPSLVWPALIASIAAVLLVQPFAMAWRQR